MKTSRLALGWMSLVSWSNVTRLSITPSLGQKPEIPIVCIISWHAEHRDHRLAKYGAWAVVSPQRRLARWCSSNGTMRRQLCSVAALCILALAAYGVEAKQRKVAVVGAGVGGASAAYFLKELLGDSVSIHVFEKGPSGGRVQTFRFGDKVRCRPKTNGPQNLFAGLQLVAHGCGV